LKSREETEQGVQLLRAGEDDLQQKLADAEERSERLARATRLSGEIAEMIAIRQSFNSSGRGRKENDYLAPELPSLTFVWRRKHDLQAAKLAGANSEDPLSSQKKMSSAKFVVREARRSASASKGTSCWRSWVG